MTRDEQIQELNRLMDFFSTVTIPAGKVRIAKWVSSDNLQKTIENKLGIAKSFLGNGLYCDAMIGDLGVIEKFLKEN